MNLKVLYPLWIFFGSPFHTQDSELVNGNLEPVLHLIPSSKSITVPISKPVTKPSSPQNQTGYASWYGKENPKSCTGKRLGNTLPEAAHKTLPMGTVVEVYAPKTGQKIQLTIVDRGPYKPGRILDLNGKAADMLKMKDLGVTLVQMKVISIPKKK